MNINEKLKRLKTEDLIWIIYFFIAGAALYSNIDERKYLLTKNLKAYKEKKNINTTIFVIALIIYIYFVLINTEDLSITKYTDSNYIYRELQLIGSLLFLIGGIIYLIVEIKEPFPDEIALI